MRPTLKQTELMNRPAVGTITLDKLEVKLIKRSSGEYVWGVIQSVLGLRRVLEIHTHVDFGYALKHWTELLYDEAKIHTPYQTPAALFDERLAEGRY